MNNSWFDANSISANVASFTQKAAQIASEALIDDDAEKTRLAEELEELKRQYLNLKKSIKNGSLKNEPNSTADFEPNSTADFDPRIENEESTRKLQDEVQEWKVKFSSFQKESEEKYQESEEKYQESEEKYQELANNHLRIKALASDKIKRLAAQNQELQTERDNLVNQIQNPAEKPLLSSHPPTSQTDEIVKTYQDRIEKLTLKNETVIQEALDHQTRIDELEIENDQLKKRNTALESNSSQMDKVKEMEIQQMKWKSLYDESCAKFEKMKSEYKDELQKQVDRVVSEKQQIVLQLESEVIDKQQLQSLLSEQESQVNDLSIMIENQKNQMNEFEIVKREELQKVQQVIANQNSEMEALQEIGTNQKNEIDGLNEVLSFQKIQIEGLESDLKDYKGQLESIHMNQSICDHKPTQTSPSKTHASSTQMDSDIGQDDTYQTSSHFLEKETEWRVYETEWNVKETKWNAKETEWNVKETEWNVKENELNEKIETLNEKLAIEEEQLSELKSQSKEEREEMKRKWEESQSIVVNLTETLNTSNSRIEELLEFEKQLENSLKMVQAENGELEVKYTEAVEKSQSHKIDNQNESIVEQLKIELEKARLDCEDARNLFEAYRNQAQDNINNDEANDTISVLQGQIQEYQTTCTELQKSIDEMQTILSNLSNENESLNQEKIGLTDRLQQFKLAVGAKIQQEIEESDRLRADVALVTQENVELSTKISGLSESLEDALKNISQLEEGSKKESDSTEMEAEIAYLQSKSVDLIAKLQKSEAEVGRLREYLLEAEENSTREALTMQAMIQEYKLQIASLENEREEWSSVRQHEEELRASHNDLLDESKIQVVLLLEEKATLGKRIEEYGITIKNLQNVLAQFEAAKEQDIEDALAYLKKSQSESESNFIKYQQLFDDSQKRSKELEADAQLSKRLQKELQEKTALIGQLRHDIVQLQSHLNEAMRYMKQGSNEDTVDRKLVANLIVGLMLAKYGDPKRFEILTLIASILKLSEDEKAKLGLVRQAGTSVSPRNSVGQVSPAENFMDMWITFLQTETTKNHGADESTANVPANSPAMDSPSVSRPPLSKGFSFF